MAQPCGLGLRAAVEGVGLVRPRERLDRAVAAHYSSRTLRRARKAASPGMGRGSPSSILTKVFQRSTGRTKLVRSASRSRAASVAWLRTKALTLMPLAAAASSRIRRCSWLMRSSRRSFLLVVRACEAVSMVLLVYVHCPYAQDQFGGAGQVEGGLDRIVKHPEAARCTGRSQAVPGQIPILDLVVDPRGSDPDLGDRP